MTKQKQTYENVQLLLKKNTILVWERLRSVPSLQSFTNVGKSLMTLELSKSM